MKRKAPFLLLAAILCAPGCGPRSQSSESPTRTLEILSRAYTVDGIYRSMKGPSGTRKFQLYDGETPELLWITGYHAVVVGLDGETEVSQEFMCHSNLDFNVDEHQEIFGGEKNISNRLFTLSQGQFSVRFPDGFGLPIASNEALSLNTQVLNLNLDDPDLRIRQKVTIDFVRDAELTQPMKPLYMKSATGLVLLDGEDGYYNVSRPNKPEHGPGCLVGEAASFRPKTDQFDRKFAGHWVVKPGREVNQTLVTNWMNLSFDTTIHYIAVHLHPFAESLELKDLTTGETVFKSKVRNFEDKIGLEEVEYFSSAEGLPVYAEHQYELISVYNNTTNEDQDSMAVMFMYVLDPEFSKPDLSSLVTTSD